MPSRGCIGKASHASSVAGTSLTSRYGIPAARAFSEMPVLPFIRIGARSVACSPSHLEEANPQTATSSRPGRLTTYMSAGGREPAERQPLKGYSSPAHVPAIWIPKTCPPGLGMPTRLGMGEGRRITLLSRLPRFRGKTPHRHSPNRETVLARCVVWLSSPTGPPGLSMGGAAYGPSSATCKAATGKDAGQLCAFASQGVVARQGPLDG